jgi:hypothetical protein
MYYSRNADILNRLKKPRANSEALTLDSYIYATPSVQERIMLGLPNTSAERTSKMEKYLEYLEKKIRG